MANTLPQTSARLRSSINIYAMVQLDYISKLLTNAAKKSGFPGWAQTLSGAAGLVGAGLSASILKDSSGQQGVNSLRNFSRDQKRETHKRYSLGVNSHQAFQVVPLKVETSLTIERVILYKNDLLKQLFGFWGECLVSQQMPMMIVEHKSPPPGGDITQEALITYLNCWFTTNPIEYEIEAEDQLVIQDVEVDVGSVIVYDATANGLVNTLNTVLDIGKNIKI